MSSNRPPRNRCAEPSRSSRPIALVGPRRRTTGVISRSMSARRIASTMCGSLHSRTTSAIISPLVDSPSPPPNAAARFLAARRANGITSSTDVGAPSAREGKRGAGYSLCCTPRAYTSPAQNETSRTNPISLPAVVQVICVMLLPPGCLPQRGAWQSWQSSRVSSSPRSHSGALVASNTSRATARISSSVRCSAWAGITTTPSRAAETVARDFGLSGSRFGPMRPVGPASGSVWQRVQLGSASSRKTLRLRPVCGSYSTEPIATPVRVTPQADATSARAALGPQGARSAAPTTDLSTWPQAPA